MAQVKKLKAYQMYHVLQKCSQENMTLLRLHEQLGLTIHVLHGDTGTNPIYVMIWEAIVLLLKITIRI